MYWKENPQPCTYADSIDNVDQSNAKFGFALLYNFMTRYRSPSHASCNMQLCALINILLARAPWMASCSRWCQFLDSHAMYRQYSCGQTKLSATTHNKYKMTTRIISPRKGWLALMPPQHYSRSTQIMLRGRCCLPKSKHITLCPT